MPQSAATAVANIWLATEDALHIKASNSAPLRVASDPSSICKGNPNPPQNLHPVQAKAPTGNSGMAPTPAKAPEANPLHIEAASSTPLMTAYAIINASRCGKVSKPQQKPAVPKDFQDGTKLSQ